ncbi:MAG: hypothetical protein ACRELY_18420 [Polyangiaceae bacterium]
MNAWTSPSFEEIKMDAEIGSYQEDRDPMRDEPPFVQEEAEAAE